MPSITTALGSIFAKAPLVTVSVATSLLGPWTPEPHLWCDRLRRVAAPEIEQADFRFEYGEKLAPGETSFTTVSPLDHLGKFVKVEIEDWWNDPPGTAPIVWYGVLEVDTLSPYGSAANVSGIQSLVAYGLLRFAERFTISQSYVETYAGGDALTINRGLTFNMDERGEYKEHGNRNGTRILLPNAADDCYVFDYRERATAEWSARDQVDYLLAAFCRDTLPNSLTPGVAWRVDVTSGSLAWSPRGGVPTDRRTLKSLLDDLISRHRGVGYRVVFDDVANEIVVKVFSFSDSNITMPNGTTFLANPDQYSLDFEQSFDIQSVTVSNKKTTQFHKVIVEGDWRTSTMTLSLAKSGLSANEFVPDWDASEQTAFFAGASGESWYAALGTPATRQKEQRIANDKVRHEDRFRHVFARFKLSDDWDGISEDPEDLFTDKIVFPEVDVTSASGAVGTENCPTWIPGLTILDYLPLRERVDYFDDSTWVSSLAALDDKPPFLQPFAFVQTNVPRTPTWEMLDKLDGDSFEAPDKRKWSVNTKAHHDRAAIMLDVSGGPQQFLAKSDWATAALGNDQYDTHNDPAKNHGLDWFDCWVTLTMEMTERCRIEKTISTTVGDEQERVLRLHVEDCRLDYLVPNTVVAIQAGELQKTVGGFVRDDRERLATFAESAALWYGVNRQTLELSFRQIRDVVQIGWLITDIGPTYQKTGINSVVTAVSFDFLSQTTRFETQFVELDFA